MTPYSVWGVAAMEECRKSTHPLRDATGTCVDDQTIARLAVAHRILTREKLQEALDLQKSEKGRGRPLTLGEVLLSRGMLSENHLCSLQLIAEFQIMREPDRLFSKIAIKNRLATREQVENASRIQAKHFKEKRSFRGMGEILLDLKIMTRKQCEMVQRAVDVIRSKKNQKCECEGKSEPDAQPEPISTPISHPEEASTPDDICEDFQVLSEGEQFDLLVSHDGLRAYLRIKEESVKGSSPDEIRQLITKFGIIQGIADDAVISSYLQQTGLKNRMQIIAAGIPPKPGDPGRIRFSFEEGMRQCDDENDKCTVDLKNRGRIPQVKCGDLIAEIVLSSEGVNGMDVYGRIVPPPKCSEQKVICGKGVEKSPDGLHFYAQMDGRPQLSVYGTLSVLPELVIEEDVSFETGNIMFDGRVEVRGIVQDGFRVECDELAAREISKAHIEVNGNVTVLGGILGARIKSQGSVSAAHIHASRIEALGDVIVEKGIVESTVITAGKCLSPRGKVVYSKIMAGGGIEVGRVGSERSEPCSLAFGFDPVSEREIESLKESVSFKERELEAAKEAIGKLNDSILRTEAKIGTLAQVQDRSTLQLSNLAREARKLKESGDPDGAAEKERLLVELEGKIKNAEAELDKLLREHEEAKDRVAGQQREMREIHGDIQNLKEKLSALAQWAKANGDKPGAIKVHHSIGSGTTIKGPLSSLILKSDLGRVLIKEQLPCDSRGENGSVSKGVMKVYNLS